jgi:hypothetical protein
VTGNVATNSDPDNDAFAGGLSLFAQADGMGVARTTPATTRSPGTRRRSGRHRRGGRDGHRGRETAERRSRDRELADREQQRVRVGAPPPASWARSGSPCAARTSAPTRSGTWGLLDPVRATSACRRPRRSGPSGIDSDRRGRRGPPPGGDGLRVRRDRTTTADGHQRHLIVDGDDLDPGRQLRRHLSLET